MAVAIITLGLSEARSDEHEEAALPGVGCPPFACNTLTTYLGAPWSRMSAKAKWDLEGLEGRRSHYVGLKRGVESRIAKVEQQKALRLRMAEMPGFRQVPEIGPILANIEDLKHQIACYAEEIESFSAQILEFNKGQDARAAERISNQDVLAALALELVRKDEVIDRGRQELLGLLEERQAITSKMKTAGRSVELDCDWCEGAARSLAGALSAGVLEASRRWLAWFTGRLEGEPGYAPYTVRCDELTLPETLAHLGRYHFGDRVFLTEQAAAPLLKAGNVLPTETFEQVSAEASEKDLSADMYLKSQDREKEFRAKRQRLIGIIGQQAVDRPKGMEVPVGR